MFHIMVPHQILISRRRKQNNEIPSVSFGKVHQWLLLILTLISNFQILFYLYFFFLAKVIFLWQDILVHKLRKLNHLYDFIINIVN